jgi:hypothetical protein
MDRAKANCRSNCSDLGTRSWPKRRSSRLTAAKSWESIMLFIPGEGTDMLILVKWSKFRKRKDISGLIYHLGTKDEAQ